MFFRFMMFLFGLCVLATGISTVTHAGLGTGTVSSAAIVLSQRTGLSMGFFVFATNAFFFVLQTIVDRRDFLVKAVKQLPVCALFGLVFDGAMWMTSFLNPTSYAMSVLQVMAGTVLTGLGISGMVYARLLILPPEGLVLTIMHRWGGSFGTLRMGVDIFLVVVAVILSLIFFGTIVGLREGTLITALGAGRCANVFLKIWGRLFPKHRAIDWSGPGKSKRNQRGLGFQGAGFFFTLREVLRPGFARFGSARRPNEVLALSFFPGMKNPAV